MTKKAFTLVEVMIVVAIVGILAAIIIPNLMGVKDGSYVRGSSGQTYVVEWIEGHKYYKKYYDATPVHAGDCPLCVKPLPAESR